MPVRVRLAAALVACAIGAALLFLTARTPAPDRVFAGSGECRSCHARFYELWSGSLHGTTVRTFTQAIAEHDLPSATGQIAAEELDVSLIPGEGRVTITGTGTTATFRISRVIGGRDVLYFLADEGKGRLQTLPIAWDIQKRRYFHTGQSAVRAFHGDRADRPLPWTDRAYAFTSACYRCHVSQPNGYYDPATDTYRMAWKEDGINCEHCHGPGVRHAALFREAAPGKHPDSLHIISTSRFSGGQVNAMCAPCHAKMRPLTDAFRSGDAYFDHFDLATLEDPDFTADGRDLGENYTFTRWRMSPCVVRGGLDCIRCHTSGGRFRFTDNPDASCLPCHTTQVEHPASHTHHPAGTIGCIDCHMPATRFARMRRSDHSMLPPAPAASIAFGGGNACTQCHDGRSDAWADSLVRRWHTYDYQAPVLQRGTLVASARKREWRHLPAILSYIVSPDAGEITTASLLRLLRECPDETRIPAILASMQNRSSLVRAAAIEALDGSLSPALLPALYRACDDSVRLVRVRAAAVLAGVDDGSPGHRLLQSRATGEYVASLRTRPDDHTAWFNLGNLSLAQGKFPDAITAFRTALTLQADDIASMINVSRAYALLNDLPAAEKILREALRVDSCNAPAWFNLGLVLGETGRAGEAESALRASLAVDSMSGKAWYNLAVVVSQTSPSEAARHALRASRLDPANPDYAFSAALFHRSAGAAGESRRILRTLIARHPGYADGYGLLAEILVDAGDTTGAARVLRQALAAPDIPVAANVRLQQQLGALRHR